MTPRALTIAGSDVSGGAGIEADLKMFQESGVFGTAVLTCIVTFDPENDFGHALDFMEPDTVQRQLDSTLAVHRFDVLKSGMLGSVESALVLAERLRTNELPYVFDPVLVCKGPARWWISRTFSWRTSCRSPTSSPEPGGGRHPHRRRCPHQC